MARSITKKFRILEALYGGPKTVDGIWRLTMTLGVGYGCISPTLNLARRAGLVIVTSTSRSRSPWNPGRRPFVWSLTPAGRLWVEQD